MWRNSRLTTPQKRQSDCRRLGHSRLRVASRFTLRIGLASWQTQPPSHAKIAGGPPSLGVHEPSDSPQVTSCHSGTPLCDRPKLTKLSTRALCKLWAEHYWDRSIVCGHGLKPLRGQVHFLRTRHGSRVPVANRGKSDGPCGLEITPGRPAGREFPDNDQRADKAVRWTAEKHELNIPMCAQPKAPFERAQHQAGGGSDLRVRSAGLGSEENHSHGQPKNLDRKTPMCAQLRTPSGQAMS